MKKLLVIVDMQNDFITGSLANKYAEAIVPNICKLIKEWDGDIICTQDTHYDNYLETFEGKHLPIKHCLYLEAGWAINESIGKALAAKKTTDIRYLEKSTFGSLNLGTQFAGKAYDEVIFVGTCTDICVISNVLIYKVFNPTVQLTVYSDLCAGLTKEKHEAALEVMKSCQVNVCTYN